MSWLIKTLKDAGKGEWYRYSITGENTEHPKPELFSWSVPSLKDERFVAHPDAEPSVVAAVQKAKEDT